MQALAQTIDQTQGKGDENGVEKKVTKITSEMTLGDLKSIPELGEVADLMLINCPAITDDISLGRLGMDPPYDTGSLVLGMQYLLDRGREGHRLNLPLYSPQQLKEDPDRARAAMTFFQGDTGAPYIILCSGGGYQLLTNLSEGFPTAARLSQLGFNVFVVTYRVGSADVISRATEDIAAAVRYVEENADLLGVESGRYIVSGFSAGGHLAALWGTEEHGFARFGLPAPTAVFLSYAAASMRILLESRDEICQRMLTVVMGENFGEEEIDRYSMEELIDKDYPSTFLWHCRDDESVPFRTAKMLAQTLERYGVPYEFMAVDHGGHGRGLALNSEAEGWTERATAFWKTRCSKSTQ